MRSLFTVPSEGEDVVPRTEVGWDLDSVHDGEEELREAEHQHRLTEAQQSGAGGRELRSCLETVRLHLSEVSAIGTTAGRDGVLGPL